ncbi:uncharacterized protein G2W53_026451 [Senna tora]|uniref:Uncharacterized protein n=1 Tax=Senna tora TaxID=362788 RepID=A0A834TH12_9FABA|nr:uncharacterized protein G2W53_026451 [Senna tora]
MSVRVVFANQSGFDAGIGVVMSGFDAGIGVVMAWEERRSCHHIFRTTNRDQISKTFTNYEAKDLLRNRFDTGIGVFMEWEERGSCLNIFQKTNLGRISETFTNYEATDLLRKLVRVVFANWSGFDAGIGIAMAYEEHGSRHNIFRMTNPVRSLKLSRIMTQNACCESE